MSHFVGWLSSNAIAAVSIFGAAVAFMVSTWQQVSQRRAEANERQFEAFHKVVESVVSPDPKGGLHYVDRQAAVIFELRHFPRYYDFTERMLERLKQKWLSEPVPPVDPPPRVDVLIEEIDLTLNHIRNIK